VSRPWWHWAIVAGLVLATWLGLRDDAPAPAAALAQAPETPGFYVFRGQIALWIDPRTGCEYFLDTGTPLYEADGTRRCGIKGATP